MGNELKDSGVTITGLKPGPTDTRFFARADMLDTKVGQAAKDDPADVAATGWKAMKDGEHSVVHGLKNKAQVLASGVLSEAATAEMHRKQAEPGRSEEHTSELQSLMRISYAVFCLKKKKTTT